MTGHDPSTIRKVLREQTPSPRLTRVRKKKLDPFRTELERRLVAGGVSCKQLFEVASLAGYRGSLRAVHRFARAFRAKQFVGRKMTAIFPCGASLLSEDHFWMLRLMQGEIEAAALRSDCGDRLALDDAECLVAMIREERSGIRNRAVVLAACLICTAALELSENQVTHFYSERKNTDEMLKLLELLLKTHADQACIYFSWDAASWHASKKLFRRVDEINSAASRAVPPGPRVTLAPLPACAQFLNVIESVFSGMARAVIHNSDYPSVSACKAAIDRHFAERSRYFKAHPKRAGKKLWGQELVPAVFNEAQNCKDPGWRS